jgi:hypothetical protein
VSISAAIGLCAVAKIVRYKHVEFVTASVRQILCSAVEFVWDVQCELSEILFTIGGISLICLI